VMSFVLQGIMIAAVFVMLILMVNERSSSRDIKGQVLEKQLALLIDAADKGFVFIVSKHNVNGLVDSVYLERGKIYADVDGLPGSGYGYFSRYDVSVESEEDRFLIRVGGSYG
jgi:hypothetical protein